MVKRASLIPQSELTRFFKAAKAAGFARARFTSYPDGRIEIVGEEGSAELLTQDDLGAYDRWKASNNAR